MKISTIISAVLTIMSTLTACVPDSQEVQEQTGEIQTIRVIGPADVEFEPITGNMPTKGTSVRDGSALVFGWAIGDTLGIFPNKGNQVEFPITAAEGSSSASFDGGGWALRNNSSYAAYYPFSVWNYHRDNETIILDYTGQVQDGNGSYSHLSAYDYLASSKTTPQNSAVTFQMDRQGSIVYIDIVLPEPETIQALKVECDEAIFAEKVALDISGATPVVTPIQMTNTLTLSFENTETTEDNETVRAYMAIQPVDFSDKTVTATLVTEVGDYTAPVTPRVIKKGKAAFLRFSEAFTPVNIEFADAEVKRICVENWDTNGDGELSYKEAAAVTSLGGYFKGNEIITSFKELQLFSGLTVIPNDAFRGCVSLEEVVIPQNITTLNNSAFQGDIKLNSIIFTGQVTAIGNLVFYGCTDLDTVTLPVSLRSIGSNAFWRSGLSEITIPDGVEAIGESAFRECDNLARFEGKYASLDGYSLVKEGKLISVAYAQITDEYTIPYDVTIIGRRSIYRMPPHIQTISIPEGVTTIEQDSFYDCDGITSITLPSSLTMYAYALFGNCDNLNRINGHSASEDGRCLIVGGSLLAFAPAGLTEYTIPNGVNEIGYEVFMENRNLMSITLPQGLTTIRPWAFDQSSISQIVLPESLTSIGETCFQHCHNLTEITIPSAVEIVGDFAFYGCSSLTQIRIESTTPFEIGQYTFGYTNNCPIYVPNESVEAYKAASGWSEYADRIVGIDVNGTVVGPGTEMPD